jgi:hypothetical protein
MVIVHVVAPEDERCTLEGARRFVDSETGETLTLDMDATARADYERAFLTWTRSLEATARGLGAAYARIRSDEPLETATLRVLERGGVLV